MEMQEIATEEERKEEDIKASEPTMKTKTEDEVELEPYSKLQNPSEDIYSEAYYGATPAKPIPDKSTEGKARLYRAGCILLTVICLILLLGVIILGVKLQTGSTVCLETQEPKIAQGEETGKADSPPSSAPLCQLEQCQVLFPKVQFQHRSCQQCAKGWLTFGESCFFLSTFRLSWDESQKNCSSRGGSLAVINSPWVQRFLTQKGKMDYWIGLRQNKNTWTWVNNTALGESYWSDAISEGDCGILSRRKPVEKNWIRAACEAYTYFICQLHL